MYNNKKRFTILELIVSMSVLVVMMTIMMRFFSDAQKAWGASSGQAEIYDNGRIAMDLITSDLNSISYDVGRGVNFRHEIDPNGENEFLGFFSYVKGGLSKVSYQLCTSKGNKYYFLTRKVVEHEDLKKEDFTSTNPNEVFSDSDADNSFKRIIPNVVSVKFTCYDKDLKEITDPTIFPWYVKIDIGLLGSNNFEKWKQLKDTSRKDAVDAYIVPISKLIYLGYRGKN